MKNVLQERPRYTKNQTDALLFQELKKLVDARLSTLPKSRFLPIKIKAVVLPLMYLFFYALALQQGGNLVFFYLCYVLMGLSMVGIFLNLIHEACHGNLFKSKVANRLYFYIFDLMGANSYIWGKRHVLLHHNFPNVSGWDSDIEQSGPIKIFPHGKPDPVQSAQHRFFFFLYPLYLINWLVARDFKDYFLKKQTIRKVVSIPLIEFVKLFLFKAFYFFYMVVVPWKFFGFSLWQPITALLLMLIVSGVTALFSLLTPHVNDGNEFPLADATNKLEYSWFVQQFATTNDIAADNFFTRHFLGNFNYHLAHHLFPDVSYVYAREVTEVIRDFALKHNLPYRIYPIGLALKKHYNLLKSNALAS